MLSGCGDRHDAPGRAGREPSWLDRGTAEDRAGALAGDPLIEMARSPWKGDLDGMIERRMVRVLVVPSRTQYWLELGKHSGIEYEFTSAFERWLTRRQGRQDEKRRPRFIYIPTTVDQLIPDLLAGRGDIAAAMLTVTPERRRDVDFSAPYAQGVREVVVTGPGSTHFESLDELSGRDVFVRRSSSYWTHLEALNETLSRSKRSPVQLVAVPEELSDDEILEMVNAGLIGTTVVDFYEQPRTRQHPRRVHGGAPSRHQLRQHRGAQIRRLHGVRQARDVR